jgi:hypothetical protein
MMTCYMCCSRLCSVRWGRRGGHCYYEQGSPFLSHASSAAPGGEQTEIEPQAQRVGSPLENDPAEHLDRVWPDAGPMGIV